jgi:branched-subunit amino acid transport protein
MGSILSVYVEHWPMVLATLGLAVISVVSRCFFFISERELPLPGWLRQGLRYAPLAALAAIIGPQLVLTDGVLITTWRDARLFGAAAGLAWYAWRRGILGTIVCGMAVFLPLRLGLGW